jgi:hypothetical protein
VLPRLGLRPAGQEESGLGKVHGQQRGRSMLSRDNNYNNKKNAYSTKDVIIHEYNQTITGKTFYMSSKMENSSYCIMPILIVQ